MKHINWREVKMYPESSYELRDRNVIREYCLGGKAIVTLLSPTGKYHSYYICTPWMEDKDEFSDTIRFVYVLNKLHRWVYLGELCNDGQFFRKTKNSKYMSGSEEFKGMVYIVKLMNKDVKTPMKLYHAGCCSRCGRKLTDPISIERGFGTKCYKQSKM